MNGERVAPPLSPVDGLTITMNSRQVQLTTDFGLTVRFDGKIRGGKTRNHPSPLAKPFFGLFGNPLISLPSFLPFLSVLEIILPSTYEDAVRGLCGNYDDRRNNEYMKPDGTVVRDLQEFGDSWRVDGRQAEGPKIFNHPHTVHIHR